MMAAAVPGQRTPSPGGGMKALALLLVLFSNSWAPSCHNLAPVKCTHCESSPHKAFSIDTANAVR